MLAHQLGLTDMQLASALKGTAKLPNKKNLTNTCNLKFLFCEFNGNIFLTISKSDNDTVLWDNFGPSDSVPSEATIVKKLELRSIDLISFVTRKNPRWRIAITTDEEPTLLPPTTQEGNTNKELQTPVDITNFSMV